MSEIEIRERRFDAPESQALIRAALADLGARYGGSGDETPVDAAEFTPPDGAFLVAYLDGRPVGCGGWRSHGGDGDTAELKRMYTDPAARGRGVARSVLAAVERSARDHGRKRIVLECGDKQPEAIAMYTSAGYERIPNFGFYKDAPGCLSYARTL
ncbi:GNAT family N-acetyltransferase [Micromonospora tulbaghiae]|uniref:Acetyltransferase (GNAT) family protein n=1 Tax=Micromonospora tulbaghiae TaxID=479978 RepID=A0AAW4JLV9_9ACTN|nr:MULTISPECIES: GNAT family N-acetyltransferase [Micromonospora]KAB1904511.1 GNAT family N-acetyltransferase [Micromonospora sp. AMSO1212t]MBO4143406.1 GNAT family N-acetyltransferase [Micromonospora tulbaghiae]MDX5459328.1 GNAT family N-acetyltransferase [Micromonospora tulbaghiae]SCE83138.1 Acetyltransferase (GNAT) family protein [Micromonospora tulbaghiae]